MPNVRRCITSELANQSTHVYNHRETHRVLSIDPTCLSLSFFSQIILRIGEQKNGGVPPGDVNKPITDEHKEQRAACVV